MSLSHILIKIIADFLFIVVILWALIAMLRLPKKHRIEYIIRGVVAGITAEALGQVGSHLYHHLPPFAYKNTEALAWHINNVNSFPSDHMMLISAATFVVWASTRNHKLGLSLLAISIVVGAGRVLALVHWPVDILASAVIAAVTTVAIYSIPFRDHSPLWSKRNNHARVAEKSESSE